MLMLKTPNRFLPGGFAYTQDLGNGTKMEFDGNTPLRAQIHLVLKVRQANKLPRATLNEVAEDVAAAICRRHPGSCVDGDQRVVAGGGAASVGGIVRRSGGCGHCGGRRAK